MYIVLFIENVMYVISGSVKDVNGSPLIRKIFLLNKDTMSVLDSVYSKIDGSFEFKQYTDDRRLVLIKSEGIDQSNSIVLDNINPVWDGVPNPSTIDTIGIRGTMGFGVGYCLNLPPEFIPMPGHDDPYSENYGNYKVISDGSIMVWIPKFYYKWGTGSNGLALNDCDIKGTDIYANETLANAAGYALHRSFIDGGDIKDGFFIDKFMCSKHPTLTIASSLDYGAPINSNTSGGYNLSTNFGLADMNANFIPAAKLRGDGFHCQSIFQRNAIVMLLYAHGKATTDTNVCAWYKATNNFVRGNTNSSGIDLTEPKFTSFRIYDNTSYYLEGRGKYPFEMSTHNGQSNGVSGIVGNRYETLIGLTYESSKWWSIKESIAMKDITEGTTATTDHWGTPGKTQFDDIGADVSESTTGWQYISNGTQAFHETADKSTVQYKWTNMGFPKTGNSSTSMPNPNIFGGAIYFYKINQSMVLSGGSTSDGNNAGPWCLNLTYYQKNIGDSFGFRSAFYIS